MPLPCRTLDLSVAYPLDSGKISLTGQLAKAAGKAVGIATLKAALEIAQSKRRN